MVDYRIGAGNIQDKPGPSCGTWKKWLKKKKRIGACLKDTAINVRKLQWPKLDQFEDIIVNNSVEVSQIG